MATAGRGMGAYFEGRRRGEERREPGQNHNRGRHSDERGDDLTKRYHCNKACEPRHCTEVNVYPNFLFVIYSQHVFIFYPPRLIVKINSNWTQNTLQAPFRHPAPLNLTSNNIKAVDF